MSIRVHRSNEDGETFVDFPAATEWIVHSDDETLFIRAGGTAKATFARHCWTWVEHLDMTTPRGGAA